MANITKDTESVVVDIRGVSCCMPPVGDFMTEMRQQPENTVIELLTDKKEDVNDILKWIDKIHQKVLSVTEEDGYWRVLSKKVSNL